MLAQTVSTLSFDLSMAPAAIMILAVAVFALVAWVIGKIMNSHPLEKLRTCPPRPIFLSHTASKHGMGFAGAKVTDFWQAPVNSRHRSSVRREGSTVEVMVSLHDGGGVPFQTSVIDRSRGGLKLSMPMQVPVPSLLRVRALHAPDGSPWVRADVCRCEGNGGHWEIGCRFLEDPPWNVLLTFG